MWGALCVVNSVGGRASHRGQLQDRDSTGRDRGAGRSRAPVCWFIGLHNARSAGRWTLCQPGIDRQPDVEAVGGSWGWWWWVLARLVGRPSVCRFTHRHGTRTQPAGPGQAVARRRTRVVAAGAGGKAESSGYTGGSRCGGIVGRHGCSSFWLSPFGFDDGPSAESSRFGEDLGKEGGNGIGGAR